MTLKPCIACGKEAESVHIFARCLDENCVLGRRLICKADWNEIRLGIPFGVRGENWTGFMTVDRKAS